MKKTVAVLVISALTFFLFGCESSLAAQASSTQSVRVGVLLSRSGATAANARAAQMGFDAYLEHFYDNGGFKNKPGLHIEWVWGDSESTADGAVSAFEAMVNIDNVDVITGTGRGIETGPCVPLAIKYQMPFLLLYTVADTLVNTKNDYVFRPTPGDFQEFSGHEAIFKMLTDRQGGAKTAAIVVTADDYATGAAAIYRKICEAGGVKILFEETVQLGATDVSGVINRVKSLDPDILIAALQINEALLFSRQAVEYRLKTPILVRGGGFLDASFLAAAQGTAEGIVASAFWGVDSLTYLGDEANAIAKNMMTKAGISMNDLTISGWICAGVLMDVLDRAETLDRAGIAKAMAATNLPQSHPANLFTQYPGISFGEGPGQYNQNQTTVLQFLQLIDNKWRVVYPSTVVPDDKNPLKWPPQK